MKHRQCCCLFPPVPCLTEPRPKSSQGSVGALLSLPLPPPPNSADVTAAASTPAGSSSAASTLPLELQRACLKGSCSRPESRAHTVSQSTTVLSIKTKNTLPPPPPPPHSRLQKSSQRQPGTHAKDAFNPTAPGLTEALWLCTLQGAHS